MFLKNEGLWKNVYVSVTCEYLCVRSVFKLESKD